MEKYDHLFQGDYDNRVKVDGEYILCYSKKKLKQLFPENNYSFVGEVKNKIPKDKPDSKLAAKRAAKREEKKIGNVTIAGKVLDLFPHGMHPGFLYKAGGYVCVGNGKFVTIRASRLPFFALLLSMAAVLTAVIITTVMLVNSPNVVKPDNPLPDVDPDIEPIGTDDNQSTPANKGSGSVSLVYTKSVSISLASDSATIYYQNPSSSNQSVVLELYVVSEDKEYFIGKTGLIPAGNAIYEMDVSGRDANIRAGTYTGLFRSSYYNPVTGEKAVVGTDITNVTVTVTE